MVLKLALSTTILGILSTGLVACNTPASVPIQDAGTEQMVERLEQIAQNMNPAINTYINAARVEYFGAQEAPSNPVDQVRSQIYWAREVLRAGRTTEAITQFQSLIPQIDKLKLTINPDIRALLGISHLRLGEQENCLANRTSESCLFPIGPAGVHLHPQGSLAAIEHFSALLNDNPDDLTSRWLLNIAYMSLGTFPEKVPEKWRIPATTFDANYNIKRFPDVAPALGLDLLTLAGGSIMEDFDGDGYLDIVASSWGPRDQLRYFGNNGDGTFSERTEAAGLQGIVGGLNMVHADYDNNGFADILVLRGGWWEADGRHPNSLLHNNGDGTFVDITEKTGLLTFHPTQTAAWGDYNNDGWLDLFIGNESYQGHIHRCQLFHNNGDGTFTDVAEATGVAITGYVKGCAWGDYNNDGLQDLYVSRLTGANFLFKNDGANGFGGWTFSDMSKETGTSEPMGSFPTWFWDFNNDGWLDLFVSGYHYNASTSDVAADYLNLATPAERPRLYRNNGDGQFTDVTQAMGVYKVLYTMGSNFGDLDNDGYLDFYAGTGSPSLRSLMPNRMFRNDAGQFFQDVTASGGFGHLQKGHGVAFGDIDNDGDQDIYAVIGGAFSGDVFYNVLFENPGHNNHWLTLQFEGVISNRSAIGTRLKIQVNTAQGKRDICATVSAGGSFGASSLQQEIGLGQATSIVSLEVMWPASATSQIFTNLAMDQAYKIREGDAIASPLGHKSFTLTAAAKQMDNTQHH